MRGHGSAVSLPKRNHERRRHCRFLRARLIVGKRHCRLLISGNINSDATEIDMTNLSFPSQSDRLFHNPN
jgi:hypothetical protein